MSASLKSSFRFAAAAVCCFSAAIALAQQSQSGAQPGSQSRDRATGAADSSQSGRSSAAQSGRSSSQPSATSQSGQRYTANYGAAQSGTAGGQGQEVDQFFANCLLSDNRAEVELSQLAEKQAKSSEVKQFAQMMVRDHQKMIKQLEQVAGGQGESSRATSNTGTSTATGSTSASGSSNAAGNASASGTSNVGGLSNSDTTGQSATDTSAAETAIGLPGSSGAGHTTSQNANSQTPGTAAASLTGASAGNDAVQQIGQIDRQIVDRKSQMMKEELQQKSGAEFDKCFMGAAVGAHTHALAALDVISQQSQGQLAQVAKQAQPTVQEHLERAKQIVRQLDGQSSGSSNSTDQAERSTSRTER